MVEAPWRRYAGSASRVYDKLTWSLQRLRRRCFEGGPHWMLRVIPLTLRSALGQRATLQSDRRMSAVPP
jgi:hypothetical protein